MKKFLLNLIGLTEVQWAWKKRAWASGRLPGTHWWTQSPHPVLTAMVVTLLGLYLAMVLANGGNPFAAFTAEIYYRFGFSFPELIAKYRETWRLLTAVFLHFNLWHVLFNSIALFQVGQFVERIYGGARFFIVFVMTGVAGNLLEYRFMPAHGVLGGASGAVFGLIGFCGLYAHLAGNRPLRGMMFQWALYAFLFGFFIHAANLAHFGGFASGLVFAAVIRPFRVGHSMENRLFRLLALGILAVVIFSFYQALML